MDRMRGGREKRRKGNITEGGDEGAVNGEGTLRETK